MKKIVSIILCLTFILGLFTVNTFAYTRPETDLFPLETFDLVEPNTVSDGNIGNTGWTYNADGRVDVSIGSDSGSETNKYLKVTFKRSAPNCILSPLFSKTQTKTDGMFAIEFDVKFPSYSSNTTDALKFTVKKSSASDRGTMATLYMGTGNLAADGYRETYFTSKGMISENAWAHCKIEVNMKLKRMRTVLTGANPERIFYSVISDTSGFGYYAPNPMGYFALSCEGAWASDFEIHLDNVRAYAIDDVDGFGYGQKFIDEQMNYDETTGLNDWGVWAPNTNQFVFVVKEGSETRNISCVTDDGDSNKYLRMNSGNVADRTYFRRSVSATKMFDMASTALATNATKSLTATLYQTKFRIDDVTKANTTSLEVTPKLADGSANASGRYLFSINPKDGIATVGNGSDIKTYDGLKLSSKQWYTLNLFHNVASGYIRAEIVDASGNKQVFEGNETDANVDYGYIGLFGFNNSSEQHTVIDFDDLRVYSAAVSDAETFYTLSDFAADKTDGTVTATVNVSSDMTNVTSGAAKLIIASYKDHELAKLKVADVIPTTGTKTFTLEGIEDGEEVKVMLWDAATNTIVPLYAPITK